MSHKRHQVLRAVVRETGRVKTVCQPISDTFPVIPAKAGIQGFQYVALGPRSRGDDEVDEAAGFFARPEGRASETGGMKRPCVYILANKRNGTLYVGVTSDLLRRVWEHRSGAVDGFAGRYGVQSLVHAEFFETMADAILREKRIKKWRRAWKVQLIEATNPSWRDRYEEFAR